MENAVGCDHDYCDQPAVLYVERIIATSPRVTVIAGPRAAGMIRLLPGTGRCLEHAFHVLEDMARTAHLRPSKQVTR